MNLKLHKIFIFPIVCAFFHLFASYVYAERDGTKEDSPFVQIGPMTITIFKEDDPVGYIKLSINVTTDDTAYLPILKIITPRLRNAYIIYLSEVLSNTWIAGVEPDLKNVRGILQRITDKTLGDHKVKAVLMDNFFFTRGQAAKEEAASK
jgi:flagellar basal body-associated protein FliL